MRNSCAFFAAGAVLATGSVVGCSNSQAQTAKEQSSARGGIELVVYSADFGLVRETRDVALDKGTTRLGITDVSKLLDQASVVYSWPQTKGPEVVSSTYDLGMGDSDRLLQRFLGHSITLVYRNENGREGDRVEGVLEVATPGNVVVRVGDAYVVNPNATIEAPRNQGIVTIPQLTAEITSPSEQKTQLGVAYLTRGLSWSSDYIATLAPDSDSMALECWATVTNLTGADYPDAKLSFVAGSPNRAVAHRFASKRGESPEMLGLDSTLPMPATAAPMPESVGELYAYPYIATATVKQDQMNRVRLMGSEAVKIKRDYSIRLPWGAEVYGSPEQRLKATLAINFENSEASGLGLPLPQGALRVYEPSKEGALNYIGAAAVRNTPKDERVSLTLTDAFDVYAKAKRTENKRIDKRHVRRTMEVVVHNQKARAVDVRLVESIGGTWKMQSESAKSTRPESGSAQWILTVPAGGEVTLKFTVVIG